jgi:PAB-dependent poly(A)-specific ribonuclease subunit 3
METWIENAKDTLCRNVTIYGKCRYEDKGAPVVSHLFLSLVLSSAPSLTKASFNQGCAFNHDPNRFIPVQQADRLDSPISCLALDQRSKLGHENDFMAHIDSSSNTTSSRKGLNVDSPSFTPSLLHATDVPTTKKTTTISPKAVSAAPFLPKSVISRTIYPPLA